MSFFEKLFGRSKRTTNPAEAVPSISNSTEKSPGNPPPAADEPVEDLRFKRAIREGDPKLPAKDLQRWITARRRVMTHLVDIATSGPWVDYLVLRGSLSLKSCLGEEAREPGDIDWVIQPSELEKYHPEAKQMISSIIRDLTANPNCGDARIEHEDITSTSLWAYQRFPGHRIIVPWRCKGMPPAIIQMDFAFGQPLHSPTITEEIRFDEGTGTRVAMASLEESLAWKIRWLRNDRTPQAKDLYDATLLAERAPLPLTLLSNVLKEDEDEDWNENEILEEFPFSDYKAHLVEWEDFAKAHSWVQGTEYDWHKRFVTALQPMIDELKNKKWEKEWKKWEEEEGNKE